MKNFLSVVCVFLITGCTTMRTVEAPPGEIQNLVVAGEAFDVGDRVEIVTRDGAKTEFKVVEVTADMVIGENVEILISDIISVEKSEFSGGKTVLLAGGGTATVFLVALLIALSSVAFMP